MPSHQERRKEERVAAKRAAAEARAAGAAEAATGIANVNVNPLGDWTTQTEDHDVGCRHVTSRYIMEFI
jgi:hypothetical protein